MVILSKPEATPKKTSNKRLKRKLSEIEAETHTRVNSVSDDGYKGDSESSNTLENVSTDVNIDETDTEPFDTNENYESGDDTSIQPLIIDEKKNGKEKQDVIHHISGDCVKDRKLFVNCTGGDIEKYKLSVKLESSNQPNVWVGVGAKPSLYYYICTKNSDGSMTTFFINQHEKKQFDSALKYHIFSDIKYNDVPHLDFEELPRTSIEYAKVDDGLVINQIQNPTKTITFDKTMIYSYWRNCWMLERFVEYLRKRVGMIRYCWHIFDSLDNIGKGGVAKDDFTTRFESSNPPNFIFTSQEMWCYLLKKHLGY